MKKTIALTLVLMMTLSAGTSVFAASGAVPADVKGTPYEDAVQTLMGQDIISGYSNGTFCPANSMDRAEACAVVVKAMNPVGADLFKAQDNRFSDMNNHEWALKFVNYAVAKGIVKGTGKSTFNPAGKVTYNEMATMLVSAVGYKAADLSGTWPSNYVNKAKELGIFNFVTSTVTGDAAATRGDVALMTVAVSEKIAAANKGEITEATKTTDGAIDNGEMSLYTGRAYGMVLNTEKVTNSQGKKVDQIKLLMGSKIYYLNTDGTVVVPAQNILLSNTADLYCLKMRDGIVTQMGVDGEALGADRAVEVTTTKAFEVVSDRSKTAVTTAKSKFAVMDQTVVYIAVVDGNKIVGYEAGNLRDVEAEAKIRAFDLTDDKNSAADVVIIVKSADAKKF